MRAPGALARRVGPPDQENQSLSSQAVWQTQGIVGIDPGDTLVVALNAEHMPALPLSQAVTQIIYNVAIAAAAVHSF
jgi:hypothetical protein